ncbi:hypothetical protein pdam_00005926 [Pocillopora damicornis]|uniref:Uncharacterized protein n=1 Tax=Pocillopora damicornis TaxID=46731 RepID=A0A3M6TBC9_POCDA|nr:hypothetical protein pdam_00005926 [Pocillopora damicornis]
MGHEPFLQGVIRAGTEWFREGSEVCYCPLAKYRLPKLSPLLRRVSLNSTTTIGIWEPVTSFAVIPYIQGVTETIKRILNSHNVKVAQKPFQTLRHIFAKPEDPVTKRNNERRQPANRQSRCVSFCH